MLRALRREGNSVAVLSLTQQDYWESRIQELGVPVLWVGRREARPLRLLKIMKEVQRLRPDVIQSSHFFTNIAAAVAGRAFSIPAIGAVRADCLNEVADTGMLGKANLRLPPWIAANSRRGAQNARMMGVPADRIFFLPNVVDCDEFQVAVRTPHNPICLMTAGRLVEEKRHDRFIRLIARLRSSVPSQVRGIIVGDGPKRDALQQQMRELRLTEQDLEFRGMRDDIKDIYNNVDIFVLTSDFEGTPNVILEAMASGLPVVSTDVGDVTELIKDGVSGFIVNKENEEALVGRVRQLVENVSQRKGFSENARRHTKENFSIDRLSAHLNCLYGTVT
jgi:glycosyltransferase involved in cell wall biosynthesis